MVSNCRHETTRDSMRRRSLLAIRADLQMNGKRFSESAIAKLHFFPTSGRLCVRKTIFSPSISFIASTTTFFSNFIAPIQNWTFACPRFFFSNIGLRALDSLSRIALQIFNPNNSHRVTICNEPPYNWYFVNITCIDTIFDKEVL